jgi:hypothetical protein
MQDTEVHNMALEMQQFSDQLLVNPSKLPSLKPNQPSSSLLPKKKPLSKNFQKPLTSLEKKNLVSNIRKLPQEHLIGMI